MERVFAMPDLGEGLEEGRVVEWLVAEGDEIALNQPLVEIETAKAAVEIPSPFAGRVLKIHGRVGDAVPVDHPLVTFELAPGSVAAPAVPAVAPLDPDVTGPVRATIAAYPPTAERHPGTPVRATPPVRKLAKEIEVEIETVDGSGPGGRVTEADVRRVAQLTQRVTTEGIVAAAVHEEMGSRLLPVDAVRQEIAGVLERQAAIPQVTTFRIVDCSALEGFRTDVGMSPLPIFVAALCTSVRDHPLLNAAWREDMIETREKVNVGLAVDTDRGLLVPVVQDAGRRGIADLTAEIHRLAEDARAGRLALEDKLATATIAVSNTGSYGSEAGTPILAPGTSVTLAFGVIAPRPLVVDGAVVARPAATISLTFDHRVLDGATAGRALTELVSLLESAERLGGLPR
jgi:pyruvate dehydrogenase E2 component (dihydrolipoamide acetyltransferase)